MPLVTKKKGQSKSQFMQECMSDPESKKTFPDLKQRLAVCFRRFGEKKAKAAYVISTASDEFIYAKMVTRALPPKLVAKVKTLPESGPGYHKVKITFKGTLSCVHGIVRGCDTFETEDDMPDNDMMDIEMDD